MAESYIVNGNIYITLKDNEGYIIRHKFYSGAYFCINFDGTLTMATGARMHFKFKDWLDIQNALQEGYNYMSKLVLMGSTTFNHKPNRIETFKSGYLYKNHQGKAVFIKQLERDRYLEIIFSDSNAIISTDISSGVLRFNIEKSIGYVERMRVRKSKPTKLLNCLGFIGVDFDIVEVFYNGNGCYRKTVKELQNVL